MSSRHDRNTTRPPRQQRRRLAVRRARREEAKAQTQPQRRTVAVQ